MEPLGKALPRLTPTGVLELADNDAARPRAYPRKLRLAALGLLVLFAAAGVASSAASLGAYCLTTDAGNARPPPVPAIR